MRTNNEDMALVDDVLVRNESFSEKFEVKPDNRLMLALADGMGGHNCGEVASNDTLTNLRFFFRDLPATLDDEPFRQALKDWLKSICMLIDSKGKSHQVYQGMGTTLVGMVYFSGRYYWINWGDSRRAMYITSASLVADTRRLCPVSPRRAAAISGSA